MKKIILFCLFGLLFACAPKAPVPPQMSQEAEQYWDKMQALGDENVDEPYRMQISLRIGEDGNTRRVTGLLWGQDNNMRLDIMAGVGVVLAKIHDFDDKFILYTPRENKAFEHIGANKPLLRVGAPLPFNLPQLAALLNGSYAQVFGPGANFIGEKKNLFEYELQDAPSGTIWLDENGLPMRWQNASWRLALTYNKDSLKPHSLRLENNDGKKAILNVKEREQPAEPFTAEQLDLKIPDSIEIQPLSEYQH